MGRNKKVFWDERSKKLHKRKKSRPRSSYSISGKAEKPLLSPVITPPNSDIIISVPSNFSFIKNLPDTATFFFEMLNRLKTAPVKASFLIESNNVTTVTTDAIMYLIALMRNYKLSRQRFYSFRGTYPDNLDARKVYMESGLLKFVKSKSKRLPENNSKMSIMSGKNNDPISAGKMCDFVAKIFNTPRRYNTELYEVIIEMMSNVYYHAYSEDEEKMFPEWFMYAEHINGEIKFLFLDTGLGIARTVKKHNLYEKVINKIGIGYESKLIKSTLDGDFRTKTEEINHGKGMPLINDFAKNEKITDFHIISGRGHCWIDNQTNEFQSEELKNKIFGTIYSFTINNRRQIYEN